jgi:hypothetical protein
MERAREVRWGDADKFLHLKPATTERVEDLRSEAEKPLKD